MAEDTIRPAQFAETAKKSSCAPDSIGIASIEDATFTPIGMKLGNYLWLTQRNALGEEALIVAGRESASMLAHEINKVLGVDEAARVRARKALTDRYYAGGKVVQLTPVKPAELVDIVVSAIFGQPPQADLESCTGLTPVILKTIDGVVQDPTSDAPAAQLGHFAATEWMRAEIAERRADRAVAVLREIASNDSDGLEVFTPQAMQHKARAFIDEIEARASEGGRDGPTA